MQYARIAVHIGVGSALLVSTERAMREPKTVERVTDTDSTLFYFSSNHFAWESARKRGSYEASSFLRGMQLHLRFCIGADALIHHRKRTNKDF